MLITFIFWFAFAVLFYCFAGYAILLWVLVHLKKNKSLPSLKESELPEISFVVAAYNEKAVIDKKIDNSLSLNYPGEKIIFLFITDGSNDGTDEIVKTYPQIKLFHQDERKGKSAALNRVMQHVKTPLTVFSDANTLLNKEALIKLVAHFADNKIGGVSGEKKITSSLMGSHSGIGEGLYWLYESKIKKLEARFYSLVGSAGELFSIRTALYKPIPENIILDDFYTSLSINQQGYNISYEPNAVSSETPSASIKEEQKRKVRIAAGAFQVASVFSGLLNFFRYPAFAFQFFSHKILRWFLAPACIVLLLVTNILLADVNEFYQWTLYLQYTFYVLALAGWLFHQYKQIIPVFYFPFYFLFMNYCTVVGWWRYLSGKQKAAWERSERATLPNQ